jgi:ABC-type lipoprotein release transport system permease subunit
MVNGSRPGEPPRPRLVTFLLPLLASVIELRNVSFIDAGAFGAGLALVTAAAAVAAWQPARRAASIDPARALRPDA